MKYTNYKGETYYLHEGTGKKGEFRYSFSKKQAGAPATSIPKGYEIYEDPNGRVFLRKIAVVDNCIRQYAKPKDYKIDAKGKAITKYLPDHEIDDLRSCFDSFVLINRSSLDKSLKNLLTYSPVMRFILTDQKGRRFEVERVDFFNDDWVLLDGPEDLQKLAKRYCRHLGKDSFYDLL